jgi:hypothetical protein
MPTSASSGHPGETDEMVKMEISSLAVIGLPPSTFSRNRHRRLDAHCAMVGRRDKKRSVSFTLGDGGLPFGAFLFCEAWRLLGLEDNLNPGGRL